MLRDFEMGESLVEQLELFRHDDCFNRRSKGTLRSTCCVCCVRARVRRNVYDCFMSV